MCIRDSLVSSCFILVREKDGVEEKLAMGDCAINIDYPDSVDKEGNVTLKGSQKLAEVAIETANTAKMCIRDRFPCGLSGFASGMIGWSSCKRYLIR